MDARELRIGNFLDVDGNFWTLDSIIGNEEVYFKENPEYNHVLNAKPIPLTKQWLERFGFEIERGEFYDWYYMETEFGSFGFSEFKKNGGWFMYYPSKPIKYVHQLQNLFHALTGKELELK